MILAHLRVAPLTVAEALNRYGIYALSQRVGELKRDGFHIASKMIEVREGVRVAQYSLVGEIAECTPVAGCGTDVFYVPLPLASERA